MIYQSYYLYLVPEISVKYYQLLSSSHTHTYPTTNEVSIPLSTQEVSLSTNIVGKWNIPEDTNTSSSTVDIGTFIEADTGLYTFYTNNWDGAEVIAMQITISSSPALSGINILDSNILNKMVELYFRMQHCTTKNYIM